MHIESPNEHLNAELVRSMNYDQYMKGFEMEKKRWAYTRYDMVGSWGGVACRTAYIARPIILEPAVDSEYTRKVVKYVLCLSPQIF